MTAMQLSQRFPTLTKAERRRSAGALLLLLPQRRRILDAALVPKFVEAAVDLEARAGADVALKQLAVVADRLHDIDHEVIADADTLAEFAVLAEQPPDIRIGGILHLADVGLGDPGFFGIDQGKVHPFDDGEPLVVALAHRWSQR